MHGECATDSPAASSSQMDAWIPLQAADGTATIEVIVRTKINRQRRSFILQLSAQAKLSELYDALIEQLVADGICVQNSTPRLFFKGRTLDRNSTSTLMECSITGEAKQHIVLVLAEHQPCEAPTNSSDVPDHRCPLAVGAKVEVLFEGKYLPARILSRETDREFYCVEWIGENAQSPGVPRSFIRTLYDKTRDHIVVGAQYSGANDQAVVAHAMLFLSHPAMAQFSDQEKIAFLEHKGVKKADAVEALRRSSNGEAPEPTPLAVPSLPAHLVRPVLENALDDDNFKAFLQSPEFAAAFAPIKAKIRDSPASLPALLQDMQRTDPNMLATVLPFVLCEVEQSNPSLFSTLSSQYGVSHCPSPSTECPPTSP